MDLPEKPPAWFVVLFIVVVLAALGCLGWGAVELWDALVTGLRGLAND